MGAEDATEHQCRVLPVVAGAVLMAPGLLPRLEGCKAVLCSTCLLFWQSKVMYLRLQRAQWGGNQLVPWDHWGCARLCVPSTG